MIRISVITEYQDGTKKVYPKNQEINLSKEDFLVVHEHKGIKSFRVLVTDSV